MSGVQQEQLLDALLTLTRVNASSDRPDEQFDLAEVAQQDRYRETIWAETEECGLHVDVVLGSAPVQADRQLVELLLVNLLDNAIRHNISQGGIEVVTGRIHEETHPFVSVQMTAP